MLSSILIAYAISVFAPFIFITGYILIHRTKKAIKREEATTIFLACVIPVVNLVYLYFALFGKDMIVSHFVRSIKIRKSIKNNFVEWRVQYTDTGTRSVLLTHKEAQDIADNYGGEVVWDPADGFNPYED